jgi:hypothetical protein
MSYKNYQTFKILCFLLLISFSGIVLNAQDNQPKRPVDYKPYQYKYSVEKLYKKFSKSMKKEAEKDMAELHLVNKNGKYKPLNID